MNEKTLLPIAPWGSAIVEQRLTDLTSRHQEVTAEDVAGSVHLASTTQVHRYDRSGLSMYAGSNIQSPLVEASYVGALATRPSLGWPGAKVQPGLEGIESLEVITVQQLRRAFNAAYGDGRYVTATMANLAMFTAFTKPGDTVAVLPQAAGGHASHLSSGTAGVRGLNTVSLPYDPACLDIDHRELTEFLERVRPSVILIGGSVIQFPNDLAPLRDAADRIGARLVFDASHVAGLIAGGVFPNPLDAGVDLVTFSTYKTLGGPAGGASVTNSAEVAERVTDALYPTLSSNYDAARLGPLAIALAEAVEQQPAWAKETVEFGQLLGAALTDRGFALQGADRGFTETHQLVVDVTAFGGGDTVMQRLAEVGLLTGTCRLATQEDHEPTRAVRFGTQELVRLGATPSHVTEVADFLASAIREEPLRMTAEELRQSFGSDIWGRAHAPRS